MSKEKSWKQTVSGIEGLSNTANMVTALVKVCGDYLTVVR